MKENPRITDEHIVAYIDGELHVSQEFERELRAEPSLARAADEYAAIGRVFYASRADNRFMLSSKVDARTKKMLADSLAASRKAVRTAAPAPNAAPVRSIPARRSVNFVWAKRASVGFAFASLLAFLWFNFTGKNEQITQVPVPVSSSPKAPVLQEQPAPVAPEINNQPALVASNITGQSATPIPVKKNLELAKHPASNDLAANTMSPSEAPRAATNEQAKTDPADVMISHRYAKMIKSTPVVEVTEQDRM